ncbi:MAG: TetR/AcrR family transcriptional regulator [Methanomassiliicoccales archaeon]|nr:TetR/AcrR family transcriptional regulator [Methanomassiliicoccales archaeon]
MNGRMGSDARKAQVLGTALKIVHQSGISALTLRQIANDVGVSEAALFRHFKSKEDIVNALAIKVFEENQFVPRGDGPWETLQNMMTWQLALFQDNPMHTSVLFQEDLFRDFPVVKERFDLRRRSRSSLINQLVKGGQSDGTFSPEVDGEAFAILFMGSIRMAVLEWRQANFSYDLRSNGPPLLYLLRKGLEGRQ